jgi:uncharacterized repeat protein (TIGR01451 family)
MKAQLHGGFLKKRTLLAGLALTGLVAANAASQAEAAIGTAAGTTILNTVLVTYKDAGNTVSYSASASSFVTVNLVKAQLSISGKPTSSSPGASTLLTTQTVDSGTPVTYTIALTANANGGDTYKFNESNGTFSNMAPTPGVTWQTVKPDGSTAFGSANPTDIALGSSIIVAWSGATISIPGGSAAASGLTSDGTKVIVIKNVDYLITNIAPGHKASNSNGGGVPQTTVGTVTSEAYDVITLAANPTGAALNPSSTLTSAVVGTVAAEQVLVQVKVTGTVGATIGSDGTVPFSVITTDSGLGNATPAQTFTTTFRGSNLKIQKTVRNCGPSTAVAGGFCGAANVGWGATATGNPGDILEYKVDVINAGASPAKSVSALDAVPAYTSLISFTGTYGDGGTAAGSYLAANKFASVTNGTTTVDLSMAVDADTTGEASGDVAALVAGTPIHFYLGTSNIGTAASGGVIGAGMTYSIVYRMKMN